jgi:hypothetical protein
MHPTFDKRAGVHNLSVPPGPPPVAATFVYDPSMSSHAKSWRLRSSCETRRGTRGPTASSGRAGRGASPANWVRGEAVRQTIPTTRRGSIPILWELDQRYLELPSRDQVMLDLLYDYQNNVKLYPSRARLRQLPLRLPALPQDLARAADRAGPTTLWDALVNRVTSAGFTVERGNCSGAASLQRSRPGGSCLRIRGAVGRRRHPRRLVHPAFLHGRQRGAAATRQLLLAPTAG